MTVYVDDMHLTSLGRLGRMRMCHMIADTSEELRAMARLIGVDVQHIQYADTPREHFDISLGKRTLAVSNGAVEITMRELAIITRERRLAQSRKEVK